MINYNPNGLFGNYEYPDRHLNLPFIGWKRYLLWLLQLRKGGNMLCIALKNLIQGKTTCPKLFKIKVVGGGLGRKEIFSKGEGRRGEVGEIEGDLFLYSQPMPFLVPMMCGFPNDSA